MTLTAGILLFDRVDLMDVAGPYEVLLTANRLAARDGDAVPFAVLTVGCGRQPRRAYGGLALVAQTSAEQAGPVDLLIVPGAVAITDVAADPQVVDAVRTLAHDAQVIASVCTGAFLLAAAGLLRDVPATTHWEDVDTLGARDDVGPVRDDVRWVDAGRIVTAGGLSSGIAMALHLVERWAGRRLAEATARQIDYPWTEHR